MENLLSDYASKKGEIQKRLQEFKQVKNLKDEDVFVELSFCLLTPQSKADSCWKAVTKLKGTGLLFKGNQRQIGKILKKHVRFHNNKAKYIADNRKKFTENGKLKIKGSIFGLDGFELREWLVENVKGFGYKEASHFLRNVGFENLAILDRHILKNLAKYKAIDQIPKSLSKKNYFEIEKKFQKFSETIGIPMDHLDLLFWAIETGKVFK